MAIRILKNITIVCDTCKKEIAHFIVFIGSTGLENTGQVWCMDCSSKRDEITK